MSSRIAGRPGGEKIFRSLLASVIRSVLYGQPWRNYRLVQCNLRDDCKFPKLSALVAADALDSVHFLQDARLY